MVWANPLCDALDMWRRLERLVHAVTGAAPRQNDLEWQRIFSETGVLTPPSRIGGSGARSKRRWGRTRSRRTADEAP